MSRVSRPRKISLICRSSPRSQEVPVRLGRDRESIRDLHPGGCQLAVHLAERGVLAADQRDVVDADFVKPLDVSCCTAGRYGCGWFFKSLRGHKQ